MSGPHQVTTEQNKWSVLKNRPGCVNRRWRVREGVKIQMRHEERVVKETADVVMGEARRGEVWGGIAASGVEWAQSEKKLRQSMAFPG